jgi:hypothetical protein
MSQAEEAPVEFNKDHYPNGLNSDFIDPSLEEVKEKFAGTAGEGGGRFEDPESRDIAAHADKMLGFPPLPPFSQIALS